MEEVELETDLAARYRSHPERIRRPRLCTKTRRSRTGQGPDAWIGVRAPSGEHEMSYAEEVGESDRLEHR